MQSSRIIAALALALAGGACDTGDPAAPGDSASAQGVGPAPLRRLTNVEYLNALHDLFPNVDVTLPALPPDIPVAGFENAAEAQQASDVLVARYETIANLYAAAATKDPGDLRALVGCSDWSTPSLATSCSDTFFSTTGLRIFRRPLDADERERLESRFRGWQAAVDFEGAAQLTLSAMLQSPQFLYRPEPVARAQTAGSVVAIDSFAMASRLSFFLWESVPDATLLDAASRGALATESQIRDATLRMLDDPRAERVFWDFPRQWLGLDRILLEEHAARTIDPAWTSATQASAQRETELFVRNVLAAGGTLRDLMTSRRAWIDDEMARIYGMSAPAVAWTEVELRDGERAGLLTRASFLAGYSHRGATSPPVRGNGIELHMLCRLPMSPPPGVDLSQPTAKPGDGPKTTRTLFEERTQPAMCQSCHADLNGLGFGLESYDAAGRWRTSENGLPIDASGAIRGTDVDGAFRGAIELSEDLAKSNAVHTCATQEMVRYALGRAPTRAELPAVESLAKGFALGGGDVRSLLLAIATSPSFRRRVVEEDPP
jgi:hypothetical protein